MMRKGKNEKDKILLNGRGLKEVVWSPFLRRRSKTP
jgi:hypothetical protein